MKSMFRLGGPLKGSDGRSCPSVSEQDMLLYADGELGATKTDWLRRHLDQCVICQSRLEWLSDASRQIKERYQAEYAGLPPIEPARVVLKAGLSRLKTANEFLQRSWWKGEVPWRPLTLGLGGALCLSLLALLLVATAQKPNSKTVSKAISFPDPILTPGSALITDRRVICAEPNIKNKDVSILLKRRVFAEYRMPGADPDGYEVDYLVTPALGGADDIRNLWPHSYTGTIWNARVKDELEDRLRDMVCNGELEPYRAQYDIASNWIAAYKHYFRTDRPIHQQPNPSRLLLAETFLKFAPFFSKED
jgi:hypothetical protein